MPLTTSLSYAEGNHHNMKQHISAVESLSPTLRELLVKEMLALQDGMKTIIPAYVSGDWDAIATIADKMEKSYILKQSLTKEQKKELHSSLPSSFISLDQEFHYLAGMLKHVAKNKKTELVGFYYSKLNETCLSCHTQYATHRFPALDSKTQSIEHVH